MNQNFITKDQVIQHLNGLDNPAFEKGSSGNYFSTLSLGGYNVTIIVKGSDIKSKSLRLKPLPPKANSSPSELAFWASKAGPLVTVTAKWS